MRLDETVLDQIARSLPTCSLVLVGPLDPYFEKSNLKNHKNVFMLGGKDPGIIQDYIAHFDICINPQAINQLTIGNYPRKIDEYLAAGKPVVATRTEAMKMFSEHTHLCTSPGEYVTEISRVLEDRNAFSAGEKEKRRNFALEHTWENCIGMLGDAYYETEMKKQIV
jgi:glycosyltransferase involved in cell wall biosynthesis